MAEQAPSTPARKKIGFLSFGYWRDTPGSRTRTASDALHQTIDLAQAAEEIGVDGAYLRVHHWEHQLASFGERSSADHVGGMGALRARSGRSYIGDPEVISQELSHDLAVREADTVLFMIPNLLGVEYNTRILQTITDHIAPAIGWVAPKPAAPADAA
jgi:alkanesulfonate monooxygenase SsuD/methylene tetrahydromethanopterin reductase-like flavin-dependent oxidoreductase (luciferase family)